MLQSRVSSEASFTLVYIREFMVLCQSGILSNSRVIFVYISTSFIFQVSHPYFWISDNDEPGCVFFFGVRAWLLMTFNYRILWVRVKGQG